MKLKYYLNGFGIGVLFATIILSIAFLIRSSNTVMSDEEIIARARVLGMEMVNAETTTTMKMETEPETTVEAETEIETETEPETTMISEAATEQTTAAQQPGEPEKIAFEIASGMSSESVARLLEKKGVISDAEEFDTYLVSRGYAEKIRAGKYQILSSATYDDIIAFICR